MPGLSWTVRQSLVETTFGKFTPILSLSKIVSHFIFSPLKSVKVYNWKINTFYIIHTKIANQKSCHRPRASPGLVALVMGEKCMAR